MTKCLSSTFQSNKILKDKGRLWILPDWRKLQIHENNVINDPGVDPGPKTNDRRIIGKIGVRSIY